MRAFARRFARVSVRGPCAEAPFGLSEAANTAVQQQQWREFSAPMFRPRSSTATSGWSSQLDRQSGTAHLASTTASLAATSAWHASVHNAESSQVEEWLAALHMIDAEARGLCTSLLSRNPTLLWKDAQRTTGVVQALVDATRAKQLLRPYAIQDGHILALVDRYTPETLRARLSELHRLVWQKLDDPNVAALFASRISLDMLDLDAKALALKARALRALVPEFPPSTVLRACPELLDVQVDDLPGYIRRAGDAVVVGKDVNLELVGVNNVLIVRAKVAPAAAPPSPTAAVGSTAAPAAPPATASAGRLLRTARCGAQQLLQEQSSRVGGAAREVVRVFCNARQLIYVAGEHMEVRVEDPSKAQDVQVQAPAQAQEEAGHAACRMAMLQRLPAAGHVANAGLRT